MDIACRTIFRNVLLILFFIFLCCFFIDSFAKNKIRSVAQRKSYRDNAHVTLPWSLELGVGYTHYQDMYKADGNTALARIGIAKELFKSKRMHFGIEVDVQNGNTGRLNVSQEQLDALGGLPIDFSIKPMLDMLFTAKCYPLENSFFTLFKAGIVFRRMQFTRDTINDLSKIDPEIQLGLGWDINRLASVYFAYQGIFGKRPNFTILNLSNFSPSGHVSGIPAEHSAFIGLSIHLDSLQMMG